MVGLESLLAISALSPTLRARGHRRDRGAVTEWFSNTLPPRSITRSRHASHICPGPRRGYLNWLIRLLIVGRAVVERRPREERARKREALDPLRGPLGADLGAWNTPDLFRVGLEEDPIQPPAEAVRHPLLEVLFGRGRPDSGVQVAQEEQERTASRRGLEARRPPEEGTGSIYRCTEFVRAGARR